MPATTYQDAQRAAERKFKRAARLEANDIGTVPKCANPRRRASCKNDYAKFAKTYFPQIFKLPWSQAHLVAIDRIEKAVLEGGLFAMALPRGMGKTSLCESACMWAMLYAHHAFVLLLGATEQKAKDRLASIKVELETNPLLEADFPEVIFPIKCLGTSKKLASYQTHFGMPTSITWITDMLVFPTIRKNVTDSDNTKTTENSRKRPAKRKKASKTNQNSLQSLVSDEFYPTSGSIVKVAGITGGEIRGTTHKRRDGSIIRPTLCIPDDVQTRDSARSQTQCITRAQTLAADVAYCAGPGQPISVIAPCTIIYDGDMADRITNRELHPEYQGIRTRMVEKFPDNQKLWEEYRDILRDSLINDGDSTLATEFYRKHRQEMDLGCEVTWPERFADNELSAVQHAMNLMFRDEAAFWSEMQNEPLENAGAQDIMCDRADILSKITTYRRFECPQDSILCTAFIDVQSTCLYYVLCAWLPGFTGQVIDYGVWPPQGKRRNFALATLRNTFDKELPHLTVEGQIYKALKVLTAELCSHAYPVLGVDDKPTDEITIDRMLIDANFGQYRNTVYQFCRECRFAAKVLPSHGHYVGATSQPFSAMKKKRGERVGPHWRMRRTEDWPIKHIVFDTNYWKTFVHARLRAGEGEPGCVSLYGRTANGIQVDSRHHGEFADQLCAEIPLKVINKQKTVYEWKEKANKPDNHFFDCMVGCMVAASMCGIELAGVRVEGKAKPRVVKSFRDEYMKKLAAANRR